MNVNDYISITIDEARLVHKSEVPVVCLLLNERTGDYGVYRNAVTANHDPTAHAEIMAIRTECAAIGAGRLDEYTMFVNLEPCAMCAQAISNARLHRLYFAAYDVKSGGVENGARLYYQKSCHYKPEFYGGFMESEASRIFTEYFKKLREISK